MARVWMHNLSLTQSVYQKENKKWKCEGKLIFQRDVKCFGEFHMLCELQLFFSSATPIFKLMMPKMNSPLIHRLTLSSKAEPSNLHNSNGGEMERLSV